MASLPNSKYWTWDSARNDYYHADIDQSTRTWKYIWAKDQTTPRVLPPDRLSRPQAQPAVTVGNYTHTSAPSRLDQVTYGMNELGIRQRHDLQVSQGIRTTAVADPRSAQPLYRMPTTSSQYPTSLPHYGQSPPVSSNIANQGSSTTNEVMQAQRVNRASYADDGTLPSAANEPTGSSGRDNLDPKLYKQIKYKTHKFFVVGKVFMMLYIENAGPNPELFEGSHFTTVAHGEVAYHQFRRFVVVQEVSKQLFCYCCPITTYGNRATTKPGVDQNAHAIVYTGKTPPDKLEGEEEMTKDPIRIVPVSPDEKLDPLSRINLGKAQVVQHNWKIKEIGNVHERSLPKLIRYRKAVHDS